MYRMGKEEIDAVARVINARALFKVNSSEQDAMHLECEMQELFGTEHAIIMTSGHAALTSGLIAMGVGPGDEVIVPAYTYIATAMAVVAAGAIPVIVDVDETLTLSPEAFESAITKHTRAVIPVHIQGFPSDMKKICEIAKKNGIFVLEDACQADGGSFMGKRLGTIGDAGAFSFNYYKIISSGEGGALVTDNKTIFEKALIYHDSSAIAYFGDQLSGVDSDVFCGNEYRTNGITSAILREQLKKIDGILADLRKNKKHIMEGIEDIATFVPSNDINGDCATTLALRFDTSEKAYAFKEAFGGVVPIDTGKHVFYNWTAIMNKVGAAHPLMDPFKMEANKDIVRDYTADMCQNTIDLLSRSLYIGIDPDWTVDVMDEKIKEIRAALKSI